MRMLELFSGSGVMAAAFRAEGFTTTTIDSEPKYNPDIVYDISEINPDIGTDYDVIRASPPCTKFSVAAIGRNWIDGKPKNKETEEAIRLVEHTIKLIQDMKPKFWFIENPRGMLRKQDCIKDLPRKTVTYCQYGHTVMKPTDIWTNADIPFKPPCKNGAPCHERQPRGYAAKIAAGAIGKGTQGKTDAYERGKIPEQLCAFVAEWCADQDGGSPSPRHGKLLIGMVTQKENE